MINWDIAGLEAAARTYTSDNEEVLPDSHHGMNRGYNRINGRNIRYDRIITLSPPAGYQVKDFVRKKTNYFHPREEDGR